MIKAIIFDVDGTLSETEETHRKTFNRAFKNQRFPWHWDRPAYRKLLQVTEGAAILRPGVKDFIQEAGDSGYRLAIATTTRTSTRRHGWWMISATSV